ncbi:glycine oxidase [Nakamurella flavida]|nr:glycine oxidase ThiO [Nakamurella flavida]MDP9777943.1 glycine oxidase [Nakamurella flavida]
MRLAIVGGGVIGLTVAWRAADAGHHVTVHDPDPGRGSSWVAGGMLAPVTEGRPGEEAAQDLGSLSLERWPDFATELSAAAGRPAGLRTQGTLVVGLDPGDRSELDHLVQWLTARGRQVATLHADALRDAEPGLAPGIRRGLSVPGDLAVDNRALLGALQAAGERAGVVHVAAPVADPAALTALDADQIVLAAGARVADVLPGLPVRPVKGEIVRLHHRPGALPPPTHTVRALAHGRHVYLVPRDDGLVVGATQWETGHETTVTVGGVRDLLDDATAVLPGLAEFEFAEVIAGSRPMTPDGLPLIGRVDARTVLATGHGRNGILLAPITADAVLAELAGEPLPALAAAAPGRFA